MERFMQSLIAVWIRNLMRAAAGAIIGVEAAQTFTADPDLLEGIWALAGQLSVWAAAGMYAMADVAWKWARRRGWAT